MPKLIYVTKTGSVMNIYSLGEEYFLRNDVGFSQKIVALESKFLIELINLDFNNLLIQHVL